MIGRKQEIFAQIIQFIDAILLGFVFWLSYWLRSRGLLAFDVLNEIPPFQQSLWMLAVIMPFGPLLLEMQGFYKQPLQKSPGRSASQVLKAGLWLVLLLGLCVIFLRVQVPSRSVLLLFAILAPAALMVRERFTRWWYFRAIRKGELREPVIFTGEPDAILEFWNKLPVDIRLQMDVVERVDLQTNDVAALIEALHKHAVGRVILCFHSLKMDTVQRAIEVCELEGVEAWLSAAFIRTSVARPSYDSISGNPMLVFRSTPELSWSLFIKNAMDRIVALLALVLLSPLLVLIALLVRLTSPGPVFFKQERAGLHGKKFIMYKFRSMVADAEERREELLAHNEMRGPVFKISNDPRITPLGRILRKTSLDELPQLYNVLRGEMSLVGPRPLPIYEVQKFDQLCYRRRLSMKPGLTCLWQVRGRNEVYDFADWVRMDLEYIDNWSLGLDLMIILRTIPVVLFCRGAK